MPAIPPEVLVQAVQDAIAESDYSAVLISPLRRQPRRFAITGAGAPAVLTIYAWSLTFGGRPSLANEYRIQMTSVTSPLAISSNGPTILVGYERELNLFAGFDLRRHQTFTTGSPSVQIDRTALQLAETDGFSFHRKTNGEIAVGIRPDLFVAYALNADLLHRLGKDAQTARLLTQAARQQASPPQAQALPAPRQRIIAEVSRLSRDAAFRRQVLFAYGQRCAVTRMQLKLVEAAHILPVGAPDSSDAVQNGIALSPTYHRAYDAGLIFLDERYQMRLNEGQVRLLRSLNLAMGIEAFCAPLGKIFLPPDPEQRPSPDFIRRANRHRQIGG